MRIGADFGDRAPKSAFSDEGLMAFFPGERKTLNNVHGLMAYPSEPQPQLGAMGLPSVVPLVSLGSFLKEFSAAVSRNQRLTERDRLAFALFNSSFFQPTADSRFLLLMMAVEALIDPAPKTPEAQQYVADFQAKVENSSLNSSEKDSFLGSLEWLRQESISMAGQRLASERLSDKTYLDKTPPKFFSYVYSIRSNLVHGTMPFPTFREVSFIAANLEVFVSDLLTATFAQR
jgi:hypothetical protein